MNTDFSKTVIDNMKDKYKVKDSTCIGTVFPLQGMTVSALCL